MWEHFRYLGHHAYIEYLCRNPRRPVETLVAESVAKALNKDVNEYESYSIQKQRKNR